MTSRPLPSWAPAALVAFVGLLYLARPGAGLTDAVLPLAAVVPTVLARRHPLVAGLMVWMLVVPTFYLAELQPISLLLAAMWVVYTSARYGRTFTVVLSGLSIVAGTAAFLLWVSRTGIANSLRPYIMDVDSWRLLAVLVSLAPLAVPRLRSGSRPSNRNGTTLRIE